MSQLAIFLFGVVVFFTGGVGLVLVGLDSVKAWSRGDEEDSETEANAQTLQQP